MVKDMLRPRGCRSVFDRVGQPDRRPAYRCLDPPAQPPQLAGEAAWITSPSQNRTGSARSQLSPQAIDPRRRQRQAAVQRRARHRLADVVEPAGHQQPRKAALNAGATFGLGIVQRGLAKPGRALPGAGLPRHHSVPMSSERPASAQKSSPPPVEKASARTPRSTPSRNSIRRTLASCRRSPTRRADARSLAEHGRPQAALRPRRPAPRAGVFSSISSRISATMRVLGRRIVERLLLAGIVGQVVEPRVVLEQRAGTVILVHRRALDHRHLQHRHALGEGEGRRQRRVRQLLGREQLPDVRRHQRVLVDLLRREVGRDSGDRCSGRR